jgi:tetrahydromethanopterin S-methyltransferase subunit G
MSDININHVNARIEDLEKEIATIKAEKQNLTDPVIKGLGIKFSDLDLSKASAVIHLHNAVLERLEELTAKVQALEAKAK